MDLGGMTARLLAVGDKFVGFLAQTVLMLMVFKTHFYRRQRKITRPSRKDAPASL